MNAIQIVTTVILSVTVVLNIITTAIHYKRYKELAKKIAEAKKRIENASRDV